MNGLDAGGAKPPFRHIDDPLEGQIVGRLDNQPQISDGIADFGAFVEPRADNAVGKTDGDKTFLELARLEAGPHQHRDLGQISAGGLHGFDLRRHRTGLVGAVPIAVDPQFLALTGAGVERLAKARLVTGDDAGGGGKDMAGRTVILLQPHNLRPRKITLELQDVANLGAAPAIDRLIIITDTAQIARGAGQQP